MKGTALQAKYVSWLRKITNSTLPHVTPGRTRHHLGNRQPYGRIATLCKSSRSPMVFWDVSPMTTPGASLGVMCTVDYRGIYGAVLVCCSTGTTSALTTTVSSSTSSETPPPLSCPPATLLSCNKCVWHLRRLQVGRKGRQGALGAGREGKKKEGFPWMIKKLG